MAVLRWVVHQLQTSKRMEKGWEAVYFLNVFSLYILVIESCEELGSIIVLAGSS